MSEVVVCVYCEEDTHIERRGMWCHCGDHERANPTQTKQDSLV
jgi:hypothetical protein